MAFNIIAESTGKLDFDKIHSMINPNELLIECFPMIGLGMNGGDAFGICIPSHKANEQTWKELKSMVKVFKYKYHCKVYDLYGGKKLTIFNLYKLKKNMLGSYQKSERIQI
jgi:hypothetical protein